MWDVATGRPLLALLDHSGGVRFVAFSPDGSRLATASDDRTVRLWEMPSGKELATLRAHNAGVQCVAFSRDGLLVSGSADKTAKLWNTKRGKNPKTITTSLTRCTRTRMASHYCG